MVVSNSDGDNLWQLQRGRSRPYIGSPLESGHEFGCYQNLALPMIDSSALAGHWVWRFACKGGEVYGHAWELQ